MSHIYTGKSIKKESRACQAIRIRAFIQCCAAAVVVVLIGTLPGCGPDAEDKLKRLPIGGDFTLTDHDGATFNLKQHLAANPSAPVLLFFGFTNCPDVCPQTLSRLSRATDLLGADRERVLTLLVSVDPEHDTPAIMKKYLANFPLRARGLTGDRETLTRVAGRYAVNFYRRADAAQSAPHGQGAHGDSGHGVTSGLINHSPQIFLIDSTGTVRYLFKPTDPIKEIASTIQLLL